MARRSRACRPGTRRPSPCRGPGESACSAPQPNAVSSSRISTPLPAAASLNARESASPARSSVVRDRGGRRGACSVPSPGATAKRRLAQVGRAAEQRPRVAPQPVGRVVGGRVERTAVPRPGRDDDRLPADAAREGRRRAARRARRADARGQRQLDARRRRPPALRVDQRRRARRPQRHAPAVDGRAPAAAATSARLRASTLGVAAGRAPGTSGSPPGRGCSGRRRGRRRPTPR